MYTARAVEFEVNLLNYFVGIDASGVCHQICDEQRHGLNVFFSGDPSTRYTPRSVLVDLEPNCLTSIRMGPSGRLFNPNNFIVGEEDECHRNWASSRYCEGEQCIDDVMNAVRKEAEKCNSLEGFQLAHGLGGGTGAGFGSLIISKLREEYSEKIISTFSVMPSPKVSDFVVEMYSVGFTAHYLIEDTDLCYIFDNESYCAQLQSAGHTLRVNDSHTLLALTNLIGPAMVGATCSIRYNGQLNSLGVIAKSLVLHPRLHFLSSVMTGLTVNNSLGHFDVSNDIYAAPFLPHQQVIDPKYNRYSACLSTYRGPAPREHTAALFATPRLLVGSGRYAAHDHCGMRAQACEHSVGVVGNHPSVQYIWERVSEGYNALYTRKAFLSWYIGSGMDEGECIEAREDIKRLVEEYKLHQTDGYYESGTKRTIDECTGTESST